MPRTTLADRARKSRIRERERRQQAMRLRKLENITEAQMAVLKKIKATEGKKRLVKASSVEDWHELRAMGVVKEQDGVLVLTALGAQIATQEDK
jgi:hypothetical protein